jgi:hypothetical protein
MVACVRSQESIKKLLVNNSREYWVVVNINDRNIKNKRIVWMFTNDEKYYTYIRNKDNELHKNDNGDEHYNDTFKIIDSKSILLNSYKYNLEYISNDSLIVSNRFYKYILIKHDSNPAVRSQKAK